MKYFIYLSLILLIATTNTVLAQEWLTSIEKAQQQATASNKDIIVNFTGSDWCIWCIRLQKEVFNEELWQKESTKKYIMVKLDFPQRTPISDEQRTYNQNLQKKFSIQGFPTILLLDSKGLPYAKTGYQSGGPQKYLEHLEQFTEQKLKKDEMLAKLKQANTQDQFALLEETYQMLTEWGVEYAYTDLQEKMVSLAEDSEIKVKYSKSLVKHYFAINKEKYNSYFQIIKKHDRQQANNLEIELIHFPIIEKHMSDRQWSQALEKSTAVMKLDPDGEIGQMLYYMSGAAEFENGNKTQAVTYLEKSVQMAPNTRIGQYLQQVLATLKKDK